MAFTRGVWTSGLTESEAQEFHGVFVSSFLIFVVIAVVAHMLAWSWRPWIAGPKGFAVSLLDSAHTITSLFC
jgi:light-harvesting complex 1 beta chain